MSFNFELILTLVALVTGLTYAIDRLVINRALSKEERAQTKKNWWFEFSDSVFPVLVIVLIIRSFVVEPFRIPSASMHPGLIEGDFILVNKFTYGLRLPVLRTKVIDINLPERGDVVVFKYPEDPSVDYIKRVIGLPGDLVEYRNKTLYINGVEAPQILLGDYPEHLQPESVIKSEDLLGVKHDIVHMNLRRYAPHKGRWLVPEGHYFVMGDNRDNSTDGRFWKTTNFVPEENLVGKAFFIWMNFGELSRIGTTIK